MQLIAKRCRTLIQVINHRTTNVMGPRSCRNQQRTFALKAKYKVELPIAAARIRGSHVADVEAMTFDAIRVFPMIPTQRSVTSGRYYRQQLVYIDRSFQNLHSFYENQKLTYNLLDKKQFSYFEIRN